MNIKNRKGVGSVAGLIFILTMGLGGAGVQGAINFGGGADLIPAVFTSASYGGVVGAVLGAEKFQDERYTQIYGVKPTGLSRDEILVAISDSTDAPEEALAFYSSDNEVKKGGKLREKLLAMQR